MIYAPNSLNHCSPCTLDAFVPVSDYGLAEESIFVGAHAFNLSSEYSGPTIPSGLSSERRLAARACAAVIFEGECPVFRWDPNNKAIYKR